MKPDLMAFIAIALFASYSVFGKFLLGTISPVLLIIATQLLAGILLVLILDVTKKIKELKDLTKTQIKWILIITILSSVIGPILFLGGLKLTTATNAILIGKTEAVVTSLFAVYLLREKITKHQIIGAVIMFFGILIIATNNFGLGLKLRYGDLLIFISGPVYGLGTVLFKKYLSKTPPEVFITIRNITGGLVILIGSLFFVDFSAVRSFMSANTILILLSMVIFTVILPQYLFYKALERASATSISLAGLASPLIAIIYAVIFLKETILSNFDIPRFTTPKC